MRRSKYEGKFNVGHTFDKWTVVDGTIHGSPAKIDVQCECGIKKRVDVYTLVKGKSTSCGCRRAEMTGSNAPNWKGVGELTGTTLYRNFYSAQNKADVQVTYTQASTVFSSQGASCALTGQSLNAASASLVRIDNSQPYTVGNIQWVHTSMAPLANRMGTSGVTSASLSITAATNPNIFEQMGFKPARRKK